MNKPQIGKSQEERAAAYLLKKGFRILEKNFRCRMGEVDLIAAEGSTLVFVEVKYRSDDRYGHPLDAVGQKKQQTIRRVAQYYIYKNQFSAVTPIRFDVIGIMGKDLFHIQNAF